MLSRVSNVAVVVMLMTSPLILASGRAQAQTPDAESDDTAPDDAEADVAPDETPIDIGDPGEPDEPEAQGAANDDQPPSGTGPSGTGPSGRSTGEEQEQQSSAQKPAAEAAGEAGEAEDQSARPEKTAPRQLSDLAKREIQILRTVEARLSVGEELNAAQRAELTRLSSAGDDPRVRALASAILPWMGPPALPALIIAASDDDKLVKTQALNSLVSLARSMNETQRQEVRALVQDRLRDRSSEVACAASRLLVSLNPDSASEELEKMSDAADDLRFGCFRQYAGLPMREIEVDEPVLPDAILVPPSASSPPEGGDQVNLLDGLGRGVFLATFAGAGIVAGGLVNGSLFPPRDTLTYTRRTTTHSREEPNVVFGAAGAMIGGAALGAAAFGLQYGLGGVDFAPATMVLGMTLAGAAGGYGLGLAFNLDQPWQGLSVIGGTLGGLAIATPFAWILKPDERDLTVMASAAGALTLSGAMLTFAIVPEGLPVLFGRVRRADFGTGVGLMAGSVGAIGALLASPLLDISHGRMLASSGTALAAGALGLVLGYLIPVGFDSIEGVPVTRSRIASGLGLIAGWSVGTAVFILLPDSWARFFERVRASKATSALAIEDGKLKIGTPVAWTRQVFSPEGQKTAIGIDILSGSF